MNWKFWKKTPEPLNISPQQTQSQDPLKRTVERRKFGSSGDPSWGITQGRKFYPFGGDKKHAESLWAYTTPGVDLDAEEYIGLPLDECLLVEGQ